MQCSAPHGNATILLCFPKKTKESHVSSWPLAAGALDRGITPAIEGATDQIWFQAVVDRRAEAAAVNAIASGSRHSTMRRIVLSSPPQSSSAI
jgi:hypothetical protein